MLASGTRILGKAQFALFYGLHLMSFFHMMGSTGICFKTVRTIRYLALESVWNVYSLESKLMKTLVKDWQPGLFNIKA